ncbi:MAG: LTA synthase family protein [Clostridiaceae bacterium]
MKGKNIIIIQWESLENFVIGKTVNGQEITPNLNRVLKNSYYFDNFYEQTWNASTSDAELITNTSSLPTREGGAAFNFGENLYKCSFPNIFKNLGYNTLAAHADKASFWNWKDALQSVGYDKLIDESELNIDEKINLGLSDKSYLNQLTDILKKEDSPFLAYSVTLTSHTPFILPESDKSLKLTYNLENTKMGGYLQCINYTDKYIGEVLRKLDEKGILKNTLVVIYGDHEGIHKYYRNEVKRINGIESWMKNNDKKVPLILYNQSIKGEVKHVIGGQVDILPTVTYLFGVNLENEWDKTIGRNLLNTKKNFSVLPSGQFIGTESYPGEKEQMLRSIDICDKLIRANYYKD